MMKKFVLLALVLLLFVGNGNFTFAQQVGNEAQEIATLETKSAPIEKLSYPTIENVLWLAHKFEVSPSWIQHELTQGYLLPDIYEGLLERQRVFIAY
ncbi:hypothetical protein [Paenibacillus popilliae]|uniref:2-keto-4-pentenoate hydratase n=1 Tax=Paenibacillus popilliae ATCC 14706 TaxID=1212764 RepID=M9M459_PAEPP|nr:hypothetical protein [Paenibacillus popilliae]GAC43864.1 2-keto-4-pentenoate hydratase [Paenibacillus popilliae ATCC 14706]